MIAILQFATLVFATLLCCCGSGCIPLAAAAGDLLAAAACHARRIAPTHGTGARHRRLGASLHLTSMKARVTGKK